jgi:pimeloyl-ACP methyl ester carboxylesterase
MNIVTANGVDLAYDSFGNEADEAVLLIAGLATQRIRWADAFCQDVAARGFRVIRFDNRDAGGSTHFSDHPAPDIGALTARLRAGERPQVPYTLDDMAGDAIGLLDALSIRRAHFVGRSMGGMIAQVAASAHPERVASLTSIMSSSGNPSLPPAAPEVMAMMTRPAPNPREDETAYVEHSLAFARRIASTAFPFDEEGQRALIREEVRRAYDPGGFGRQFAAVALSGDRRPRLAKITAPTLVIHGSDDPLVLPAGGRDTAATIPGAEFMLVEGMGHDLPKPFYKTVADAIERIARRDR